MLHAKFHDHRTIGSVGEYVEVFTTLFYGHGGHLGHVTWTIYINFLSPFPRRLHMKFGFDWFQRRRCLKIMVIYEACSETIETIPFCQND